MTLTACATTSCSSRATWRRSSAASARRRASRSRADRSTASARRSASTRRAGPGRPGARSARERRTAGPRPRAGRRPGRGSRAAIKQATMMTTNAERVRSPARSPAVKLARPTAITWIQGVGESRARQQRGQRHDHHDRQRPEPPGGQGQDDKEDRRADLAGPSVIRGQQGDQGERDDGAERIEPFEQQPVGLSVVGWQAILGVGHPRPLYVGSPRDPSVVRSRPAHPNGGDRRRSRRSGDAVPARRPMTRSVACRPA